MHFMQGAMQPLGGGGGDASQEGQGGARIGGMGMRAKIVCVIHIISKTVNYLALLLLQKCHQVVWTVIHEEDQYCCVHCPLGI